MGELEEFYERYIEKFNAGDREAFAEFFHLPLTVVHAPRYDDRRAGRALATVTELDQLLAPMPEHWVRSSIDALAAVDDAAPFDARSGLVETGDRRPGLFATVTRWHRDGEPYEHLHVLYLLTREQGRLGIKVMVELAAARRARADA
ncbi:MAG: hypothetical protein OEY23_01860 [Acidimicrobiia bacterium]|nr:hypothetical protein [Acidimicrobiia bacterium]